MSYVAYADVAPTIESFGWQPTETGNGGSWCSWTTFTCRRPEYQLVLFGHDSDNLVEMCLYEVSSPNRKWEIDKTCLSEAAYPADAAMEFLRDMDYRYINS